ncbi:glycosyltransferase [Pedomonas mirosovicensis]|uniref:glycosyltransferase n=1 Tax=Pedomonas mirosovicensis TaxID=2908641 RepID=UPI00216AAC89|nr:hypothetical protein [Pedomonas mirosovicensis]MCH8684172.1 hypothetical protein [Pedomonas mirosovicensis]
MRILIGPTEIAGVGTGLRSGLRELGREADLALSHSHTFSYGGTDSSPWVAKFWTALGDRYIVSSKQNARGYKSFPLWVLWKAWSIIVLLWAIRRYDAFIFLFGGTVTNTRLELWLHRILRKRLIFVYLGSDARPPYISGPFAYKPGGVSSESLHKRASRMSRRLQQQEQLGVCVNLPFAAHFHKKPYINSLLIGLPRQLPADEPVAGDTSTADNAARPIRILHGPSVPRIKGTAVIQAVIEKLRSRGYTIEFICVHGASNAEMIAEIRRCDFVLDQIYSDLPLSTIATEAAYYGKPTIVAGYAAPELAKFPNWPAPPSLFVHPDQLEEAVEHLITNVEARAELGRRARDFVRSEWAPRVVAAKYIRMLEGSTPDEWWVSPNAVQYAQGCGLPEDVSRAVVRQLVSDCGAEALCLAHNPELQKFMLAYAGIQSAASQ